MENRFVCQFEMTLERYLAMADNPIAPAAKKQLRLFYIRNIAAICIGAVLVLICLISSLSPWTIVLSFLVTMLPVYFLASRKSRNKLAYKTYVRNNNMEKWVRKISFTDEKVSTSDGDTEVSLAYSRFGSLTQDDEYFYLNGGNDICLRMPKDSFTVGRKEDFEAFVTEKISSGK